MWVRLRSDSLIWRFPLYDGAGQPMGNPGFDPPEAWRRALDAVARDLQCLRVGREVTMQRLRWEFAIDPNYDVTIGWNGADDIGGFGRGEGMSMDASYADAAAWVAEVVQHNLAGYEFAQWPSRGRYLLRPRADETGARWVDPHDGSVVGDIGSLCRHR
ncbi:hypothetical protein [Rhodococcus sp. Eu-32]|uniref:hypothetical protein n=1 Tax=Rhodococcus sp. Eu-32 TaxID=1017319 RepID=UPI001FB50C2A|nr:hypothetical protein [Rhodococcus sp. Eu-32]